MIIDILTFVLSMLIAAVILMLGLHVLHVAAGFLGCLLVTWALIIAVRIGADK